MFRQYTLCSLKYMYIILHNGWIGRWIVFVICAYILYYYKKLTGLMCIRNVKKILYNKDLLYITGFTLATFSIHG